MTYKHSYSDYVDHILNNSPSKKVYSFGKSQRFQQQRPFDHKNLPQNHKIQYKHLNSNQEYQKQSQYTINNQYKYGRQRSSNRQDRYRKISNKIYKQRSKSKSTQKIMKNSKSPDRKYELNRNIQMRNMNYSPNKQLSNIRYKNISPSKMSPGKMIQMKNSSNSFIQNHKYNKTYVQYLQQIDHPLKKMTLGGYYPTGVQLSPNGKYSNSKIKNVQSYSFSKSPSKRTLQDHSKLNLGPGYYNTFSQFGQFRSK